MSTSVILQTEQVTKSYNGEIFLQDVSLNMHVGEVVAILGPSGSGKTTLFNIVAGLLKPDHGRVLLRGEDITGETGRVGYMLQKDLLLSYRTVMGNVILPMLIRGEKKDAAVNKAQPYFETFGLSGTEKKFPRQLSGGMRQRAALLRTYLFGADVVLLDEPFSALDTITRKKMQAWFIDMVDRLNLSTLLITHDVDEALFLCDRIYVLSGQPGTLGAPMTIDVPRPRGEDFTVSDVFIRYKKDILHQLSGQDM